jgi:putative aldouronate transport system substrate-binding protein
MRKLKKIGLLSTAVVMVALSACSTATEKDTKQTGNAPAPAAKPTITMFSSDNNSPLPPEKTMNIPTFKYLADKTNTNLDWTFLPHAQYKDQLRIRVASGQIPDIILLNTIAEMDAITGGQAMELNDLLDKFGPNLKKAIPEAAWAGVSKKGKILGIPMPSSLGSSKIFYARKDWMDKVGIKENPKNELELLDMLRAFRDKDPNGNGKKDEIPFIMREKLSWGDNIFGMYGLSPNNFHEVNGEIIPDFIHPDMKKALSFMKTMLDEKLLDNEMFVNKQTPPKVMGNIAGLFVHVPKEAWTSWQAKLEAANPGQGAKLVAIPTPRATGYTGKVGVSESPVGRVYFIMNSSKNAEAIIKMFDWLATEEGQAFANLGIPGVTQTKEGNEYKYDKQKDTDDKTLLWRLSTMYYLETFASVNQAKLGKEGYDFLQTTLDTAAKEGLPNPFSIIPQLPALQQNPDIDYNGNLFQEAAAKIILGSAPIESFDQFVATWRKQGGDQYVKELTEWYNQNVKK